MGKSREGLYSGCLMLDDGDNKQWLHVGKARQARKARKDIKVIEVAGFISFTTSLGSLLYAPCPMPYAQ